MAEQGEGSRMSLTFSAGSEEDFDFVCQPCERDKQRVEGVGYCTDCKEYLCATCYKCHKKMLVSKDHTLLDKSNMPPLLRHHKPKPLPRPPTMCKDTLTETCTRHPDELVKFYCNIHERLCCSVCQSLDHRNCMGVSYIPYISTDITNSAEFKEMFLELGRILATLDFYQKRALYNETRIDEMHKKALSDMRQFREEINLRLDKLEDDLNKKVAALKDKDVTRITRCMKTYDTIRPKAQKMLSDIQETSSRDMFNQLFITMKHAKREIPDFKKEMDTAFIGTITHYSFEKDTQLLAMLFDMTSLGELSIRKPLADVRARWVQDLDVKSDIDADDCNINATVLLPNGNLAVSDHINKAVKIIDVKKNEITGQIKLSSEPFDLTVLEENRLAVALTNVCKIQFLQISDTIAEERTFEVTSQCIGIEYLDDKLIVACEYPGCIQFMDMNCKVMRNLDKDALGNTMFAMPRCISLSSDGSVIYVTDWEKRDVTAVNLDGEIISIFKSDSLKKPVGIINDEDGVVYVCDPEDHSVTMLTPTFEKEHKLLEKKDGVFHPWFISHDHTTDKLYIASASAEPVYRNKIKVFQLEYDYM